jgi:hypothetical protein
MVVALVGIPYEEIRMRKGFPARVFPAFALLLLAGGAGTAVAQVKRVQMHIAGYLCGN